MTSHGPADRGPVTERSAAPSPIEQPPSTMNAAIISCGSRASSAASPLSWTCAIGAAWRSEPASHPAVNATGPAIPLAEPSLPSFMTPILNARAVGRARLAARTRPEDP
jgi:hypothetical protein